LMGRTNVFDVTDLVLVVEVSGTNRIELGKQGRIIPVLRHLHLIKLEILQFKMTKNDSGSGSFNPAIGFLTVVIMNPWDIEIHPHLGNLGEDLHIILTGKKLIQSRCVTPMTIVEVMVSSNHIHLDTKL